MEHCLTLQVMLLFCAVAVYSRAESCEVAVRSMRKKHMRESLPPGGPISSHLFNMHTNQSFVTSCSFMGSVICLTIT